MAIDEFKDGWRLIDVRQESLNKTTRLVNELDPKVKGLQTVVALTMTEPEVDVNGKRITFKRGGDVADAIELGPMFDDYKHGIDISTDSGGYTDVTKVKFKNSTLNKVNDVVEVDFKPIEGQVAAGSTLPIKHLFITGNTIGSSMSADGKMTLNMPRNSIDAKVNGNPFEKIDKISVVDGASSSVVSGDTLELHIPDPVRGALEGSGEQPIKSMRFTGNIGTSTETAGEFIIDLPQMQGDVSTNPGLEHITAVRVKGNVGDSKIENTVLTIDLPTGGGGTGGDFDLKVGPKNGSAISKVDTILFDNAEVFVDTTRANNKVLVTQKGPPVEIEDKGGSPKTGNVKLIKLTGDVETSSISSTGQLTIHIPHHAGLSVTDGSTQTAGINVIEFAEADVAIDSSKAKATVTPKGITGSVGGNTGAIKEIEITGTLGGSALAGGKLKIDLPAGGGGTGGSTIYGVVGSETAEIERVQVIGDLTGSSVEASTKTLKVNVPRKVAIKGGADVYSDIDTVEVANSIVQLDETGGGRKAFITPQIPFMFYGWFRDMDSLNLAIPLGGRIPTKSCGYVMDPVTHQNTLMMWMPGAGGVNDWAPIPVTGSLSVLTKGAPYNKVLSVDDNPMVNVNNQGVLTITDTTIPEVVCETLNDASVAVQKGIFNKIQFIDGDGAVDFEPDQKLLKILRAQRRLSMGSDPDTTMTQFTNDKYEGSIFLNNDDKSWWGFANRAHSKKWTKVLHSGMSDEVTDLYSRLPPSIHNIEDTPVGDDNALWLKSGWTHMYKDSESLPSEVKGKTGGFIQTFVYKDPDTNLDDRTQVLHLDSDAASYKRYFDNNTRKWTTWVKISFNPMELQEHNNDPHAHSKTHPFYKTVTFDCKYTELAAGDKFLPIPSMHVLGSSNGKHNVNDDKIGTIPYSGTYRIRGHLYFSGIPASPIATDYGTWFLSLYKRPKDGIWTEAKKVQYDHHSTSMVYPPLKWDMENIHLTAGDDIQVKVWFQPNTGTTIDTWLRNHPDIGFYGLRSFVSIDEQGNDGGFALGETHRKLHGKFASTGVTGVKVFQAKIGDTVRVVGEEVATNITVMG